MDLFQTAAESTLAGAVERIVFRSEGDYFTIALFRTSGGTVTVAGEFHTIQCGDKFTVHGEWTNHPKYGRQFRIDRYERILPVTEEGIYAYLCSGVISGIGPVTARKLVDSFGLHTLEVIEERPYLLESIEGIGPKKAGRIAAAVLAQRDIEQIVVFLRGYDVPLNLALKIYKHYGSQAIEIIKENPYRLSDEIYGIGFLRADAIARRLGVGGESSFRTEAAVKYALSGALNDGHTYLPLAVLTEKTRRLLADRREETALTDSEIKRAVEALADREEVTAEEDGAVYLTPFYQAEVYAAKRFAAITGRRPPPIPGDLAVAIGRVQERLRLTFTAQQKEIIHQVVEAGATVLTGGPGTGKTTIVRGIVEVIGTVKPDAVILLAAPTGRAAKRLSELTGYAAKTIHRLLGYSFEGGTPHFTWDDKNPLKGDILIVDEFSMVDILLANNLFKAVPPGMRLVLVGDVDQLPSVGPGNVLKDTIAAEIAPTVRLTQVFRQAQESQIIMNAHRINQGDFPLIHRPAEDFVFYPVENPAQAAGRIKEMVASEFRQGRDINDIQVITPVYRGETGADNLNHLLRETVNPLLPGQAEIRTHYNTLRTGDKVMQIRNNYDKGVFNGNIGRVSEIYRAADAGEAEDHLLVRFDEEEILYAGDEADELTLAYAITVHKAQGSEFPVVIMPIYWVNNFLSTRNLLYTGLTRAKERLYLLGRRYDLLRTIKNNRVLRRYSKLVERLNG